MEANHISEPGKLTARAALAIVALYVALAVGAPWLLNDAPPSAQDVLASQTLSATIHDVAAAKAASTKPAR